MKIAIDECNDDILRLQELYQNTKRNQIEFLETLTERFIKKHLRKHAKRKKNKSIIASDDTNYRQRSNPIRSNQAVHDIYEINLRMIKNNPNCKVTAINHFQDYFCEKWTREERCKKYSEIFSKFFPSSLESSILNDSVQFAIKKNIIRQNISGNRVSDFVFTKNDMYSSNLCPKTNGAKLMDAILLNKEHKVWDDDIDSQITEKNVKHLKSMHPFSKTHKKNKIKNKKKNKITKRRKEFLSETLSHTDSYTSLNTDLTINNSKMFAKVSNWAACIENTELIEINKDNFILNNDSVSNTMNYILKEKKKHKRSKKAVVIDDSKIFHNGIKWAYSCIGNSELSEICASNFISNGNFAYCNLKDKKNNKRKSNFKTFLKDSIWVTCIENDNLLKTERNNLILNNESRKNRKKSAAVNNSEMSNSEIKCMKNSELSKWADMCVEDNKLSEIKSENFISNDESVYDTRVNNIEEKNENLNKIKDTEIFHKEEINKDNFKFCKEPAYNKTNQKIDEKNEVKKKNKMTKRQKKKLQKDLFTEKLNNANSNMSLDAALTIKSSEILVKESNWTVSTENSETNKDNIMFYDEYNKTDYSVKIKKEEKKTAAVKNSEIFDEEIKWANTCIENGELLESNTNDFISNNTCNSSVEEKEEHWRRMKFHEIFDKESNWADMCPECSELPAINTNYYEINKSEKERQKEKTIRSKNPQSLVANTRISVIKNKVNGKSSKNIPKICPSEFDTDRNDFLVIKRNIENCFSVQLVYSDNQIVPNFNENNICKVGKILFIDNIPKFYPMQNVFDCWPKEMREKNIAMEHKNEIISLLSKNNTRCTFIHFPMIPKKKLSLLYNIEVSYIPEISNFNLELGNNYKIMQQKYDLYFKNKCTEIENEIKNRYDFRNMDTFTILKKRNYVNRAFSCNILENKNYEIIMHISDVSYFLSDEIFHEMLTSKKICMNNFPKYKNYIFPYDWCKRFSLDPGKDKVTISVIWEIDDNGNLLDTRLVKSVINCNKKFKFKEVQTILTTSKQEIKKYPFNIETAVKVFFKLADMIRIQRLTSHKIIKLHKESIEYKLKRGFKYYYSDWSEEKYELQHLYDEYEILANLSVAQYMYKTNADILLMRVQPQPAFPKEWYLSVFEKMQKLLWSPIHNKESKARVFVFNSILYRIMPKEYYECKSKLEDQESLINLYTHFTRPIERYFDIIVQRLLFESPKDGTQNNFLDIKKVTEMVSLCNNDEKEVQREKSIAFDLCFVKYLLNNPPIEIDAVVYKIDFSSFQIITCPFSYIKKFEFHTFCKQYKCSINCISSEDEEQKIVITWLEGNRKTEELKVLTYVKVLLSVNSETKEFNISFSKIPKKML